MSTSPKGETRSPGPPQFGLRALLAATVIVAISCSLFISMPPAVATSALVAVSLALPAVLTVAAIHARGYWQTFCIGALFPAGTMLLCTAIVLVIHSISAYQNNVGIWLEFAEAVAPYYRPYVGACWAGCLAVGLLSMLVRWLAEGSGARGGT
jgi:hypothetical protein